jgi:hypothetical protein
MIKYPGRIDIIISNDNEIDLQIKTILELKYKTVSSFDIHHTRT